MSSSDRFGWTALVMTPLGVGIAILWPTERPLGWILMGFGGIVAAIWIYKEVTPFGKNAVFPTFELLVCFFGILLVLWMTVYPRLFSYALPFVPPQGPGIKTEMNVPIPSNQLCSGLSGENETQCLCPHPVEFSLKPLASPNDNNYATQVTVTAGKEPMYHLRLFARSIIHPGGELWASPYGKDKAVLSVGIMAYDLYSVILHSSSPEQEFKLEVHSAEGLRIKCVNQEN